MGGRGIDEPRQQRGQLAGALVHTLATFMGHADIVSTEYYLRLAPSNWTGIQQAMAATYADLYPHGGD
ncbi:MAG: hypothetical protein WCF36_02295 [Candidatus Nanopelagicales bacterium]